MQKSLSNHATSDFEFEKAEDFRYLQSNPKRGNGCTQNLMQRVRQAM